VACSVHDSVPAASPRSAEHGEGPRP
jgi:hypothetical protein